MPVMQERKREDVRKESATDNIIEDHVRMTEAGVTEHNKFSERWSRKSTPRIRETPAQRRQYILLWSRLCKPYAV